MGHIPKTKRDVRVVLIPKLGREPNLVKFYHSISLSSSMFKTLERFIDKFLRQETLARHPLQESLSMPITRGNQQKLRYTHL